MAGLAYADMIKRDNWKLFLTKIENSAPFETVDKKEVILGHSSAKDHMLFIKMCKSMKVDDLKNSIFSKGFPTKSGAFILLSKLQKTKEFGSAGNTTAKEDKALDQLREAIVAEKKRTGLIELPFKIKSNSFKVYDAISTPGTPKSDFHFVDKAGKEVYWMSHKDGRTEKDFQQWGGISEKEIEVNKHKETQKFIESCKAVWGDRLPNATTAAMKIKSDQLKNMAVYGVEYGKAFGRQNVNACYQGDVSLKLVGKFYEVFSPHTTYNGEVPHGGYDPVFMIIYKGDRDQFGIGGARLTISPMGCRKITAHPPGKEWL